ncbi:cupin domain-containing protein [Zobellella maritima]|uniref:cupin domain-containing protein n=1 Tax=Zobellella maritima TaxID=2059725 RepID=UPI0013008CBE|nr:cupin domain-containing protein [Zobellella maritima]
MPVNIDDVVAFSNHSLTPTASKPPPERRIEGTPRQGTANYFTDSSDQLDAGFWESEPGKWHAVSERNEFCYILEGHVRIADEQGNCKEFRQGDAFLIPYGFKGTWQVLEFTKKYYVIFVPKER